MHLGFTLGLGVAELDISDFGVQREFFGDGFYPKGGLCADSDFIFKR